MTTKICIENRTQVTASGKIEKWVKNCSVKVTDTKDKSNTYLGETLARVATPSMLEKSGLPFDFIISNVWFSE